MQGVKNKRLEIYTVKVCMSNKNPEIEDSFSIEFKCYKFNLNKNINN